MLRFGLFAGRLSHEIALFHCLRAILRFSLELHFLSRYFLCKVSIAAMGPVLLLLGRYKTHPNMYHTVMFNIAV